jgi:peptide/nickel transport system permease protein
MLRTVLKRFGVICRRNWTGLVGLFLVGIMAIMAIFAPLIAPYNLASNLEERLQPPSLEHLCGTDVVGRDVFSRAVYGCRTSLVIAVATLLIALTIGGVVGTVAGFFGGLIDEVLARVTDIFLSFPALILALAISAAMGPGLKPTVLAIAIAWWPSYARMFRGQVLTTKNNTYIEATYALGSGRWRTIMRHILPNCISPIIIEVSLDAGAVIIMAAGLSFIGLGIPPPTPEWGKMVSEGARYILGQWWISTFPGLALAILVIGFNMAGDSLRDLLDPRKNIQK